MDTLSGKKITLCVSGGVAAYKSADLASRLVKLGADVHVVMTRHAMEFIGAATFQALTGNKPRMNLFEPESDGSISHITLAQECDVILIAPATANILAKMTHGIADDLVSSLLLAASAPVMVAPAMNTFMWENPATQENLRILQDRGILFINPISGILACGTEGVGKMAEPEEIVRRVINLLTQKDDLCEKEVLISVGATREPLDPVRFISNRSSGKMGFALAEAARDRGAKVTVIKGYTEMPPPYGVNVIPAETVEGMLDACRSHIGNADIFISAAAPADYKPAVGAVHKIKKSEMGERWNLEMVATPDILAAISVLADKTFLVGFAAETENLIDNAKAKLHAKKADMIVANPLLEEGSGFGSDTNIATLLFKDGRVESLGKLTKRILADRILDAILREMAEKHD
jgi:phosphopantothenoylcysteine decarboxylase/phosphopantothenate--cysteine ligase